MKGTKHKKILIAEDGKWEEVEADKYALYKRLNPKDRRLAQDNLTAHRYNIAIECIARREELYFKEWIEHHLRLGIEHIFIYDNNDEEGLEEFLKNRLSAEDFGKIEVIPWRERMAFQQWTALEHCAALHENDVKWLLSIDLDEFLILEKPMQEFLSEFADASEVYFSWENIGADGQLHYEARPVMERFKTRVQCKDFGQGKVMFRPDRLAAWEIHGAKLKKGKIVNVLHEEITPPDSFNYIYRTAWIRHFFTKSLEEWKMKIERGCADNLYCRRYAMFFDINPDLKEYYDPTAQQIQKHALAPKWEIPME